MKKLYCKPVADRVEFMSLSVLNVSNYDNMQSDIDWNSETGSFELKLPR